MLSPSYLDGVAETLLPIYSELQTRIQADIARRIAVTGEVISSAEWQIIKLRQIGMAQAEIQKAVADALKVSEAEVVEIFRKAGIRSVRPDRVLQKAAIKAGKLSPAVVPLGASATFQQVMNANAVRTLNTLKRLTGTIAIDTTGQLNKYMDMAQLMVQSGAFTHEQAAQATVQRFAADGVGAFDYFSGMRTSIEAAVRRALVTGVNQATAEISLANAAELGTDLVEVTSHADSRPEHAKWQGGVYSISGSHPKYKKLSEATGYGTVTGLCGANCRHSFYAFIEGLSEKLPKEEYDKSTYEAEQEQRYNERMIRLWKRRATTLEAGGVDASAARGKVSYWQARQQEHIQRHNLARLHEREQVYNKSGIVTIKTSDVASKANKMYNVGTQSENIMAYLRDQPLREKIRSDSTVKKIVPGQQRKHITGTLEYDQYVKKLEKLGQYGPSRLSVTQDEAQVLVDRYHGTGILGKRKDGSWNGIEEITAHTESVGTAVNNLTGAEAKTTVFKIHYGKNGTHIVPGYPSRKEAKAIK